MSVITDTKLETIPKSEYKDKNKQEEIPIYLEQISDLSDEDKTRLIGEILDEYKEIKEEYDALGLHAKWDALDNQYDGKMLEDERRMFNLCKQVTKVKVNKVTNLIMQSLMDSDPKFSVRPKPGFQKQGGQEICDKQSDYLDDRLDYIPFREPEKQTVHSAVLKGTGYTRMDHLLKREQRKREETYKGTPGVGKPFQIGIDPANQQPIMIQNDGLAEFLRNWPDAAEEYPEYIKQLSEGKEIRFVAKFTETTYDDPTFINVNLKNFFARISCDGYEDLKTTKLTVEIEEHSYWNLKREEKKGRFYDIDDITYEGKKDDNKKIANFKNKTYQILRCVFYCKLKEDDEEDIKCIFWIHEEKRKMIGSILYPWYAIDCEYVPHYISKKNRGLLGDGLGDILTDSQYAESSILNHVLESAWMRDLITPIVKRDSGIYNQFINKAWTHGVPLVTDEGDKVDFLQNYMKDSNVPGMINLLQYLTQNDDDATGVSSLMSGRESPNDPSAPASKTIALLKQSGIDIQEYILTLAPSFNMLGSNFLLMCYQIAQDGIEYHVKPDRMAGENPFETLTRAEMIAKTNIQVMATSFDFEKIQENQKDLALYQTFRQDPIVAQYPEAIYVMAKNVIKSWSKKWANQIDQIMPSPDKFKRSQLMTAVQAIAMYTRDLVAKAQLTGQPPQIYPKQLLAIMQQAQVEAVTPPSKEVMKEREQNAA